MQTCDICHKAAMLFGGNVIPRGVFATGADALARINGVRHWRPQQLRNESTTTGKKRIIDACPPLFCEMPSRDPDQRTNPRSWPKGGQHSDRNPHFTGFM